MDAQAVPQPHRDAAPTGASGKYRKAVVLTSAITALGGLLFGYDTGVVSGALLFLQKSFGTMSAFDKELVTALLLVGAAVGAFCAGKVADLIGRRITVMITALIFIGGVLGAALSPSFGFLVGMRFIIGLAVGSASMVVPMYIGEMAPRKYRGALVSFNQLAITMGILVSYLIDYFLSSTQNWRLMFGLAAIPAALLLVGILTQKESPNWLVSKGREDDARKVLARVRAEDEIDDEIADIKEATQHESGWREVFSPRMRSMLSLGILMAIFQQVTGINTVIYYAPTLLHNAGMGNSASLLANVGNGAVNVIFTLVAIWLIDKFGRRALLLTGTAGMAVGLAAVAIMFIGGDQLHGAVAIGAVIALFFYTASFAVGLGPVFWLMIAEIYHINVRAKAMSVATIANWVANFVVTISFLTLLDAIKGVGTFFLFAALTVVAWLYFWRKVPETKNKSLEQIGAQIEDKGGDVDLGRDQGVDLADRTAPRASRQEHHIQA